MEYTWIKKLKVFNREDAYFVYDGYSGRILSICIQEFDLIKQMQFYINSGAEKEILELLENRRTYFKTLNKKLSDIWQHDRLKESLLEKSLKDHMNIGLNSLWLNISHTCNMACRYCFVNKGKYDSKVQLMTLDIADNAVNEWLEKIDCTQKVFNVIFFGGEPLLNLKVINHVVTKINGKLDKMGAKCKYYLTTNGTIINNEIIELIKQNDFVFSISMDGIQFIHDFNRPFANGKNSYSCVRKNALEFLKIAPKTIANMVVRKEGISFIVESVNALWKLGFKMVKVTLSLEGDVTLSPEDLIIYKEQMDILSDITYQNIVTEKNYVVENFIEVFSSLSSRRNCGSCALYNCRQLVVDPLGRKCKCYKQISGENKVDYTHGFVEKCSDCWAVSLCDEGCPLDHMVYTGDFYQRNDSICISESCVYELSINMYLKFVCNGTDELKHYFRWRHSNE